jgi:hypothetical protein
VTDLEPPSPQRHLVHPPLTFRYSCPYIYLTFFYNKPYIYVSSERATMILQASHQKALSSWCTSIAVGGELLLLHLRPKRDELGSRRAFQFSNDESPVSIMGRTGSRHRPPVDHPNTPGKILSHPSPGTLRYTPRAVRMRGGTLKRSEPQRGEMSPLLTALICIMVFGKNLRKVPRMSVPQRGAIYTSAACH